MLLGVEHLADGEGAQLLAGVLDAFDLEPEIGQRLGDLVHRGVGVEVSFSQDRVNFIGLNPLIAYRFPLMDRALGGEEEGHTGMGAQG